MTGFGQFSTESKKSLPIIDVKLKTLNSRFFEAKIHLPHEYQAFEPEIRQILQKQIRRANLDLYIRRERQIQNGNQDMGEQIQQAQAHLKNLKTMANKLSLKFDIGLKDLLSLYPSILSPSSLPNLSASDLLKEKKHLFKALEAAIDILNAHRKKEGAALLKDLSALLEQLTQKHQQILKFRTQLESEIKQRYQKKMTALLQNNQLDPQRLAQEMAIIMDRGDIHEELIRISEHLKNFKDLLLEAEGKKLDFYTQELLREFNTVGSKTQMIEITQTVVDAKSLIEKIREIVQNIE